MDGYFQKFVLRRENVELPGLGRKVEYCRPDDIVPLVQQLTKGEVQEVLIALYFDARDRLLGYFEVARGGMNWVNWDNGLMLAAALLCGARSIILAHNHPSGVARPSRMDVVGMKKLIPAARLLNLLVKDHLVVSDSQWVSMSEFGLLPPVGELMREAEKRQEEEWDKAAEETKQV